MGRVGAATIVFVLCGCGGAASRRPTLEPPSEPASGTDPEEPTSSPSAEVSAELEPPPATQATIRIATWNIENFGWTKASDQKRIDALARIVRQYDLVAVQEISDVQNRVPAKFLEVINATRWAELGLHRERPHRLAAQRPFQRRAVRLLLQHRGHRGRRRRRCLPCSARGGRAIGIAKMTSRETFFIQSLVPEAGRSTCCRG